MPGYSREGSNLAQDELPGLCSSARLDPPKRIVNRWSISPRTPAGPATFPVMSDVSGNSQPEADWSFELGRHSRWLRSVLLARSGDPGAVEELFQEVSLAAVRRGDSLRDASKTGPWLSRIAVRLALLHRRKLGRRRRNIPSAAADVDQICESAQPDPLDWLLADERTRMIRQAIDALSPKEAELLILKYTENWSYRDLAEHLDTTEGAAEFRSCDQMSPLMSRKSKRKSNPIST